VRIVELRRLAGRLLDDPALRILGAAYGGGDLRRVVATDGAGRVFLSVPIPPSPAATGELIHFLAYRRRLVLLFAEVQVIAWRPLRLSSALYEALARYGGHNRLPSYPPRWRDAAALAAAWQGGSIGAARGYLTLYGDGALGQARGIRRLLCELAGRV
jgi:hypothetical protein